MLAIDALLVLGGAWLIVQVRSGAASTSDPGAAISTITTIFGGVIGAVTGLLAVAFVIHRRRGN